MASTESAQRIPFGATNEGASLPFFSRYQCEGSKGVDFLAQDVATMPESGNRAFGYCFPPPVMVGPVLQHLAECRAHAVIIIPDTRDHWYPLLAQGTVRSMQVSYPGQQGIFVWPHHRDGLRPYIYVRWGMRAHEVQFL